MLDRDIIKEIAEAYSHRANPMRGYHDSIRTVTFVEGSSEEEQRAKMDEMAKELAPRNMWCGRPSRVGENVWTINFGYDSGD